jgi:UDP-GlcNAc:undecaprenyl-phosphate/decaprenyl-phosphate GlcNAc-1-phosphate transferase
MVVSPDEFGYLLALGLPFALAVALTPLAAAFARRRGAVCEPRADRWHRVPTPLLGGIAIYAAIFLGALVVAPFDGRLLALLAAATLVFALGLLDDLRTLPPHVKLLGQIAAACLLLVGGVRVELGDAPFLTAIELALTMLWVIGITNAFNLLDNMDGLSAGTAAIAGAMLFVHSAGRGDLGLGLLGLVVAGAAAGFLVHNFHPARVFMGDCGSMTLGLMLAGLALMSASGPPGDPVLDLLLPVAILGLPIFDTALVTIVRRLHGRPVYLGGRDHLSHRLVALGLSERGAVLVLYGISAALGALGLLALHLGFWLTLAAGALATVAIILFGIFLAQVRVYAEDVQRPADPTGRWRWLRPEGWPHSEMAAMGLDAVLVGAAYLLAYLLKYENSLDVPYLQQFADSLPYVLAIKLTALLLSGAYRPFWRYFSAADAFHLAGASLAGSVASVVAVLILTGFDRYSRSVFVIDWLLFSALLIGTRISFALLGDWFARLPRAETTRVLILGADDHGDLVLRGLMRDPTYRAVGFLDTETAKRGRRLRGVPVLGTPRDVPSVAMTTGAHEVLVATPLPEGPEHERFIYLCREMGVICRDAATFFNQRLPEDQPSLGAGV